MKPSIRLVLLYGLFCLVAAVANLAAQWVASTFIGADFWSALVLGTSVGLITKYLLDRNFIFAAAGAPLSRDFGRFMLYSAFGLLTTGLFWAAEWMGETLMPGSGRYVGGGIGLVAGYFMKYFMDSKWVFVPRTNPEPSRSHAPENAINLSDSYAWLLPLIWAAIMAAVVWRSWVYCDGHLVFTLDDPLIHMRMSEALLNGEYGINAGEPSAPSSSIIWPFLLMLPERAGWGAWGPLAINVVAMLGAVALIAQALRMALPVDLPWRVPWFVWGSLRILIGLLVCMACNSWGLPMTGLEHSLHMLVSIVFVWAAYRIAERDGTSASMLIASAALLPLIRFEGAAAAAAGWVLLVWLKRWRGAIILMCILALELAAWVFFTQNQGLPVMPSSVQMKSALVSGLAGQEGLGRIFGLLLHNLKISFAVRQGAMLLVLMTLFGLLIGADRRRSLIRFGAVILLTAMAHVCFGQYGWFSRYEIYVLTVVVYASLLVGRAYWSRSEFLAGLACMLAITAAPYVRSLSDTPAAARSIYEQQFQMRRFSVDFWKRPIAVVDLGWVSYRNPNYVLDLEGLGSEEVRKLRKTGSLDATHVADLAGRHDVKLAMVCDERVNRMIPAGWVKVAVLRTSMVTCTSDKVFLYLADPGLRQELLTLLDSFSAGLPTGSKIELIP